jgi:putative NADH-flavin reductase
MRKIIVFGAGGRAGRMIGAEAHERGHDVTGVLRDPARAAEPPPSGVTIVAGDATDKESVQDLVGGADAVVVAIGGPERTLWRQAAETLVEGISKLPEPRPRIIHMGGGASLIGPDGTTFLESPDFPAAHLDAATGQAEALDYYRSTDGTVRWTYFSPPPIEFAPGTRTGSYRIGHDVPVVDADGRSALSYEDFAVAIVDEIEQPHHINKRSTAAY